MKISHGLLILYAKLVQSICASGQIEIEAVWNLEYQWLGGNRKTTSMTVICIIGMNRNHRDKWSYPDPRSTMVLCLHPGDMFRARIRYPFQLSVNYHSSHRMSLACLISHKIKKMGEWQWSPNNFTEWHSDQNELSVLFRDLNLSKEFSELLASRLKEKNVLQSRRKITFYRRREKDLLPFFTEHNSLVFRNDIGNFLKKIGLSEFTTWWHLFIDSSKRSLKCVLLNNDNKYGSILIDHSNTTRKKNTRPFL